MIEHKLPYTAKQIEDRLEYVGNMIESGIDANLAGYAKTDDIPTKVSKLENDLKFVTQEWLENEYDSNNEPLVVNLSADGTTDKNTIDMVTAWTENRQVIASLGDDAIALTGLRGNSAFFSGVVNAKEVAVVVTGNTYEITETDLATEQYVEYYAQPKGEYLTDFTETDPTVPNWAKQASKPSYSKSEVGLGNVDNVKQYSVSNPPPYPVTSVNGETGAVRLTASDVGARSASWIPTAAQVGAVPVERTVNGKSLAGDIALSAEDVGARPSTWTPTASDVGAEKSGTAASVVSAHNTNTDAHNDIRLLITGLATRLDALANSDDETLDQMAEVVAYIKDNRDLIDQITTGKVSYTDIVNNLTTNVGTKPLAAAQGVALKALIDAITVPTKLSQLTNDSGYITGYTETDPTVPSWAKAASKPSYTKSEVGLGNVANERQYSSNNPPPYPVTSVNGKTGAVTLDASAVGALSESALPTAVNNALAQAKASGEFDGKDGSNGSNGSDGVGISTIKQTTTSTADGGNNVFTVTLTNGTSATFTVKNGSKGSNGTNGTTPVKGTDYFTAADKQEMVNAVISALPVYAGEVL